MTVSEMYSLSTGTMPLWLQKKKDCHMIIRGFGSFRTALWSMCFMASYSALFLAMMLSDAKSVRMAGFVEDCQNHMYTTVYSIVVLCPRGCGPGTHHKGDLSSGLGEGPS